MANIIKNINQGKKSMNNVLKEGRNNPNFFGPSKITLSPEELQKAGLYAKKKLSQDQEKQKAKELQFAKEVKEYNDQIADNIPEEYLKFKPSGMSYVIRYFYREPRFQEGILWRPGYDFTMYDEISITVRGGTGQQYDKSRFTQAGAEQDKQIPNPFKFAAKAVIVSAPLHGAYKAGDEVAIQAPKVHVPDHTDTSLIYYQTWFVHPDTEQLAPTKHLSDPHFGYGFVSEGAMLGLLREGTFDLSK